MTNFVWKITELQVKNENNLQDVVVIAKWKYADSENTAFIEGGCQFGPPMPQNFTDFNGLSENQIIGWIEANFGAVYIQNLQDQILQKIEVAKNAPVVKPLPWGA